ncbi:MAG: hypothetical protein MRECE_35c018 [Mycoplasmataceae bacterium CE_OT135]|nr:MAG: hypothetical protein MRECE_35c018 [Mycoplasmataceae bacterium CE_OT135]
MKPTMNNQPKTRKIHELIGKVLSKDLKRVYDKRSSHHGTTFYRLNVALENSPVEQIYVFQDYVEKEQVWKDVVESHYIDQRYVFFCSRSRRTGHYQLSNWRVLKPKEGNHE